MNQSFTIPEQTGTFETNVVIINLDTKIAQVPIRISFESKDHNKSATVDVAQLLIDSGATPTQINTFKAILKAIVAKAWEKTDGEINDVF